MHRSMSVALSLSFALFFASPSGASARAVTPTPTWSVADLARFSDRWVHVKFLEGSNVTLSEGRLVDSSGLDLAPVRAAVASARPLSIRSTFDVDRATARVWKSIGEARSGAAGPDLSLWFSIRVSGGASAVATLLNSLNACAAVEIAEPEPIVELASQPSEAEASRVMAETPDFALQQSYLSVPPIGLNAPAAWAMPGGTGSGEHFIDVELAWTENHEDFPFERMFYLGGTAENPNSAYINHGTAVLGEVIGQQNRFGVTGFAHGVDGYGMVAVSEAEWPVVPAYFQEAVDHLSPGDVWLIELQMYPPGRNATPMEWLQVNYDVIWTSVHARGVVCIEAGANGTQDLDDATWGGVFDRDVRDSGAIMVGAGTPTGFLAEWFTNWGSRMDANAWGSLIVTTGYGDLFNGGTPQRHYTATFGGTSGASPMLAGSALCLEGIARAVTGAPLDPLQLRSIIHDTGTPNVGAQYIGPRPNLAAAGAAVMNLATGVGEATRATLSVWPNPSARDVRVLLERPSPAPVDARVIDARGRVVRAWQAREGAASVVWDGLDQSGARAAAGVYFIRLDSPGQQRCVKVERLR